MDNKGLSDVVATVLLLLVTVAAIAALSGILIPFVRERLYGSTDCAHYEDQFTFAEEVQGLNYNCYDNSNYHGTSIKTKPAINESDSTITGFLVSFQSSSGSKEFQITKTAASDGINSWVLGQKGTPYYPAAGETVSYGFALDKPYTTIEVRAVLSNGKTCKASDKIEVTRCAQGVVLNG
jgi:flagellin-like protein